MYKCILHMLSGFVYGRIKKDLEATGVTAVELWWGLSQDHLSENHRQHFKAHCGNDLT